MSADSPSEKNTANLLGELETLKDFLQAPRRYGDQGDMASEEADTDEIPILFDIAVEDEDDDVPLLIDQVDDIADKPEDVQHTFTQLTPDQLKASLQQTGELLIQEIIDSEMVRLESILRTRLTEKLHTLFNRMDK